MATPLAPIGKGIYISEPHANGSGSDGASQPTVVLIFGWMGGKLPHLLKYTQVYDTIYPNATKVLIRSEPGLFWSFQSTRKAYLKPAVEYLEALGCIPPLRNATREAQKAPLEQRIPTTQPRILVHAFSNGGAAQLSTLSDILADRSTPHASVPPPSAVILDSCPSKDGLEITRRTFAIAARNPTLRRLARAFITLFYIYPVLAYQIFGKKTIFEKMRATLNKHLLLPWFSKRTPRLYLYSQADEVVSWTEVEAHAEEARKAGLDVSMESFEGSPHVAHARSDPERYWGVVKKVWEDATSPPAKVPDQERTLCVGNLRSFL